MDAITTLGLTKYYGNNRGIIDINLKIGEGEFFGFIGPNGAGKSTTIRTLLGFIKSSSGTAEIFGKDIKHKSILSEIGYLPSEAIFYPKMRVKDVIKLSASLRHKDCRTDAEILCERLKLDMSKRIEELSFGNRKKVAIVCALQHNPKLCILDEPTGGLDPLMQHEFFNILREKNSAGTTVFLSSHILSEIQHNCTRAAIIREGEIVAMDRVEKLAQTNAKRVTVHGQFSITNLENIRDVVVSYNTTSFLYNGDINSLIKKLSETQISDLSIAEPDLEDVFMHYYLESGDKK